MDAGYLLFFEDTKVAVLTGWLHMLAELNRHRFAREKALCCLSSAQHNFFENFITRALFLN